GAALSTAETAGKLRDVRGQPMTLREGSPYEVIHGNVVDQTRYNQGPDAGPAPPMTKADVIHQSAIPGWQVLLVRGHQSFRSRFPPPSEELLPLYYQRALQTEPDYEGEIGFTVESWLALSLTELHETGRIIQKSSQELCHPPLLGHYD